MIFGRKPLSSASYSTLMKKKKKFLDIENKNIFIIQSKCLLYEPSHHHQQTRKIRELSSHQRIWNLQLLNVLNRPMSQHFWFQQKKKNKKKIYILIWPKIEFKTRSNWYPLSGLLWITSCLIISGFGFSSSIGKAIIVATTKVNTITVFIIWSFKAHRKQEICKKKSLAAVMQSRVKLLLFFYGGYSLMLISKWETFHYIIRKKIELCYF